LAYVLGCPISATNSASRAQFSARRNQNALSSAFGARVAVPVQRFRNIGRCLYAFSHPHVTTMVIWTM
jgi:hypothetical protein